MNDIKEVQNQVQRLQQEGRFNSALKELLSILDDHPNDLAILNLAGEVIYSGHSTTSAYEASERIEAEYLFDTRLDSLFCQCEKCGKTWMPSPGLTAFLRDTLKDPRNSITSVDGPGGQCTKCDKVFCYECATAKAPEVYICPVCNATLSPVAKPNGRIPLQTPRRKEKLKLVLLFRDGPVPPNDEDVTKFLKRRSPDVFDSNPRVRAYPVSPWSENDNQVLKEAMNQALADYYILERKTPEQNQIEHYFTSDDEGNNVCLIKIFEKKDDNTDYQGNGDEQKTIDDLNKKWQNVVLVRDVTQFFQKANEDVMSLYILLLKGLTDKGIMSKNEASKSIDIIIDKLEAMKWTCFFIGVEDGYIGKVDYSEEDFSKPVADFMSKEAQRLISFSLTEPQETVWNLYCKWADVYNPSEHERNKYKNKISGFVANAAVMCFGFGLLEGTTRRKKGYELDQNKRNPLPEAKGVEKKKGFFSKFFGRN